MVNDSHDGVMVEAASYRAAAREVLQRAAIGIAQRVRHESYAQTVLLIMDGFSHVVHEIHRRGGVGNQSPSAGLPFVVTRPYFVMVKRVVLKRPNPSSHRQAP
jgi:hypothetical protein